MKKIFLTISLLLLVTPVLAAMPVTNGNQEPVLISAEIEPVMAQVRNQINITSQNQLRQEINTAVQTMNQTRLRINQTEVIVSNNGLIVNATQEQKQLRISNQELQINGLNLINETTTIGAQIRATISTGLETKGIEINQQQNRVQLREDECDCNVSLALNNQLRLDGYTLILNATGVEKEITVLPTQAMNQLRATNKTIQAMELVMEQERAVYKVNEQRQANLFGFIPVSLSVESRVDATTGELISAQRPWWSFLTTE